MRVHRRIVILATTVAMLSWPAGLALAQGATEADPSKDQSSGSRSLSGSTTAQPAAPETPAAASTGKPQSASTEPAAKGDQAAKTGKGDEAAKDAAKSEKPKRKMTRRQEIDRAIDTRTVPSRYRSSVPKEYQKYIPFDR
jgi:hypothetical protein